MGFYNDRLLPRAIDKMLDTGEARKHRSHVVPHAHGLVLEIGFGSGTNLPFYGEQVERVLAVDPATLGQQLAADRLAKFAAPVEFIGLDGQVLPVDDSSVDTVVSTWTLCTIPDPVAALREARRVLKPGGRLLFCEHGLHPEPKVAKMQHRLDKVWKYVAGGCHLARPIDQLVTEAGFEIVETDRHQMKGGPKFAGYLYEGQAIASGSPAG